MLSLTILRRLGRLFWIRRGVGVRIVGMEEDVEVVSDATRNHQTSWHLTHEKAFARRIVCPGLE